MRRRTPEERNGPVLLTELPEVASKIGIELRNQYVLGYSPQNQESNRKYRQVLVKIVPPLAAYLS